MNQIIRVFSLIEEVNCIWKRLKKYKFYIHSEYNLSLPDIKRVEILDNEN